MHLPIDDQRLKQRLLNKKRDRGENTVNFDYVLRSRVDEKKGSKQLATWQGPYKWSERTPIPFGLDVNEEFLEHVAAQGVILAISTLK
ncbi:hypothetical protein PHMEG_00040833 [Phytophthora megakarya]|uniref:Uncharacterized protein n=1 Tax=Phytophthora megakarya TaxID=4795 RepID=A0A225UD18_9STRA|nr:hypothetical protein PHMEG_00040833 [Phytophthora megakarya]